MNIAVIGAAGRTGRQVVEQALDREIGVRAIARAPEALGLKDERLKLIRGDVRDRQGLTDALRGSEAVISTLGTGTSRTETDLYSQGAINTLAAMDELAITRVVVLSAAPAGPRAEQPFVERRIAMPILELFFGATYADMRRMEAILADSSIQWTALRPPRLVDKAPAGSYRICATPLVRGRAITIPDLAGALLDVMGNEEASCRALYVAN